MIRVDPLARDALIGSIESIEIRKSGTPDDATSIALSSTAVAVGESMPSSAQLARGVAGRIKPTSSVELPQPVTNHWSPGATNVASNGHKVRRWPVAALAGTCAILLAAAVVFSRHSSIPPRMIAQPSVPGTAVNKMALTQSQPAVPHAEALPQSATLTPAEPGTRISVSAPVSLASYREPQDRSTSATKVGELPSPPLDRSSVLRVLAEPPEPGFQYPSAPSPSATGKVGLRVIIGSDGTVKSVEVLSGRPVLARAAVNAVRRWRYAPREPGENAAEWNRRLW